MALKLVALVMLLTPLTIISLLLLKKERKTSNTLVNTIGVFPFVLKIAKVVPVYKKDSKLGYQNYHPISLLSNIEKILEKLMYKHLSKFLNNNNVLCEL